MTQLSFFFDQSRCSGCLACVAACKQRYKGNHPRRWVECIEEGVFPFVKVSFLSLSCSHCVDPQCIAACPVRAILKRDQDGIVLVDSDACLRESACGACADACPYHAVRFDDEGRMDKCDFCFDRIDCGLKPLCVSACPARALDYGSVEELVSKYGPSKYSKGDGFPHGQEPPLVFKAKRDVGQSQDGD